MNIVTLRGKYSLVLLALALLALFALTALLLAGTGWHFDLTQHALAWSGKVPTIMYGN